MLRIIATLLTNPSFFKPDLHLPRTSQITKQIFEQKAPNQKLRKLKESKVWIFDKDDTLVPLHQFTVNSSQISSMLYNLIQQKKDVFIVSNSVIKKGSNQKDERKQIVFTHNEKKIKLPILQLHKKKPFNGEQIMEFLKKEGKTTQLGQISIVGDRLLTDVYLGRIMGWNSVLVDPIERTSVKKHGLGVYMMRHLEGIIMKLI